MGIYFLEINSFRGRDTFEKCICVKNVFFSCVTCYHFVRIDGAQNALSDIENKIGMSLLGTVGSQNSKIVSNEQGIWVSDYVIHYVK